MSNKIKQELEKIEIPDELHDKAKLGVEKAKAENERDNQLLTNKRKKKWSIGKKITYFSSAAILMFGLLFGSAFIFPSMASVMAKVPFLGTIFESEPVVMVISEKLRDKGYKIGGVSFRVRNKTLTISIEGSEKYFQDVRGDVKNIASGVLNSRNYDAYTLKVDKYKAMELDVSEEERKKVDKITMLLMEVQQELEKHDYNARVGIRNNKFGKTISLKVPNTESRVDEIKELVRSIVREKDLGEFQIKINKFNVKRKAQENRWMPVITTIFEGLLAKKEFKVTGEGYSFHPLPLRFEIRTSIKSSDPDANELGKKIENTIDNFIESADVEEAVKDDPYKVVVLSKDKKQIN